VGIGGVAPLTTTTSPPKERIVLGTRRRCDGERSLGITRLIGRADPGAYGRPDLETHLGKCLGRRIRLRLTESLTQYNGERERHRRRVIEVVRNPTARLL